MALLSGRRDAAVMVVATARKDRVRRGGDDGVLVIVVRLWRAEVGARPVVGHMQCFLESCPLALLGAA